jgi:hypothetical protein
MPRYVSVRTNSPAVKTGLPDSRIVAVLSMIVGR